MAALALARSSALVPLLRQRLADDRAWAQSFTEGAVGIAPFRLHLAVFIEPFLSYVLEGKKTIESRFSRHPIAPYRTVSAGDVVLMKVSGGPIVGVTRIGEVWNYELDPATWRKIRHEYADALCALDPHFWAARSAARYATLMALEAVSAIDPLPFRKRDRRGWVVLDEPSQEELWRAPRA